MVIVCSWSCQIWTFSAPLKLDPSSDPVYAIICLLSLIWSACKDAFKIQIYLGELSEHKQRLTNILSSKHSPVFILPQGAAILVLAVD